MDAIAHHAMNLQRTFWISVILLTCMTGAREHDVYRCPGFLARNPNLKTFRNKCYQFVDREVFWETARRSCEYRGGLLVEIRDWSTQHFIVRSWSELNWQNDGIWIGATDRHDERDWIWVSGDRLSWEHWGEDQPSCHWWSCHEDCAVIRKDKEYTWHDYNCASVLFTYKFICQYEMGPATTLRPPPEPPGPATTPETTRKLTTPMSATDKPGILETSSRRTRQTTRQAETTTDNTNKPHGVKPSHLPPGHRNETGSVNVHENLIQSDLNQLSTGATVGIGVVVILALVIVLLIGLLLVCRRRYRKKGEEFSIQTFTNYIYGISGGNSSSAEPTVAFNNTFQTTGATERHYEDIDINGKSGKNCNVSEACCGAYDTPPKLVCDLPPGKEEFDTEDDEAFGGECRGEGRHYDTIANITSDEATEDEDNDQNTQYFNFMQKFLSKDTTSSIAYSNNLYDTNA